MNTTDEEYAKAKRWAFYRLSINSLPSVEFRKKMTEKGFSPEIIEQVIKDCEKCGYLNDKEWLESAVRSKLAKRKGPQAIQYALSQKGIPREEVKAAIEEQVTEEELIDTIQTLMNTRYSKYDIKLPKDKQKIVVSLLRRGFSYDLILKSLNLE